MVESFFTRGWQIFPPEPCVTEWARMARRDALRALSDPDMAHWYQCEGTWFVGLDALDNDATGRVAGGAPLLGCAIDFIRENLGGWPALHRAQISAVFPGYPRPRAGESDAAFHFRRHRDAAHVDGIIGQGQPKRRFVLEPHQFILGIPLTKASAEASPLVVWQGSHLMMQAAFRDAFEGKEPGAIPQMDVTELYTATRRKVFETCPRIVLSAPPGAAILLHRLALHGVAPWDPGAAADPQGRVIAYFRPPMPGGGNPWAEVP